MAYARIVNTYADTSSVRMEIGIEANGPDALDECVRRVKDLWRECIGDEAEAEAGDS
jgi:hypothetical protein